MDLSKPDADLVASVAAAVSVPKEAPADSFVLHAPLELLARATLLPLVDAAGRDAACDRLVDLKTNYEAKGDPVTPAMRSDLSLADAAESLVTAIGSGDLDAVDVHAARIGEIASAAQLRELLAPPTAAMLSAAAHSSILFYLLPRVAATGAVDGGLVRGPARELARYPDWRLTWFEDDDLPTDAVTSLRDALLDVPMLGVPGSDFIFPIMNQAEEAGLPPKLLAGVDRGDVAGARRDVSRVAAWSMLQDNADSAPYGWTHCLTLPQAVLGVASSAEDGPGLDPSIGIAIAATDVIGFRSALGTCDIDPTYEPEPPATRDIGEAIADGPHVAAAVAWHTPQADRARLVAELVTRASAHNDAHYVKYTLACLDASADDPAAGPLYLAAAAYLAAWWAALN
jgi:hypothetical protein